jgi:hypothetical protein
MVETGLPCVDVHEFFSSQPDFGVYTLHLSDQGKLKRLDQSQPKKNEKLKNDESNNKKEKNRQSAERSRHKKRDYLCYLREKRDALRHVTAILRAIKAGYEKEKADLEKVKNALIENAGGHLS